MSSKRLASLRSLTTERGATEAEAATAASLADALERKDSKRRTQALDYLQSIGWPEAAAQGIVGHLDLAEAPTNIGGWRGDRLGMLHDFCSSRERNPEYLTSQLAFVSEELRGAHIEKIGAPLMNAATQDAAFKLAAPYFTRRDA